MYPVARRCLARGTYDVHVRQSADQIDAQLSLPGASNGYTSTQLAWQGRRGTLLQLFGAGARGGFLCSAECRQSARGGGSDSPVRAGSGLADLAHHRGGGRGIRKGPQCSGPGSAGRKNSSGRQGGRRSMPSLCHVSLAPGWSGRLFWVVWTCACLLGDLAPSA